jgi:hypothetical protein
LRAACSLIEDGLEPDADVTVLGCSEMSDAPIGILATRGKGRTLLFNAAPLEYRHARRTASGGEGFQAFFGQVVEQAGVEPLLEVRDAATGKPMAGWRAFAFRHGAATYFGLAPDMGVTQDVLGGIDVGAAAGAKRRVTVTLSATGHLYDARTGTYFGEGRQVEDELGPTSVRLYAAMPYAVDAVELAFDGKQAQATVRPAGDAEPGGHVLRFDMLDATGDRVLDRGANVVAEAGSAAWTPGEPLPASGSLRCTDVATGVRSEVPVAG